VEGIEHFGRLFEVAPELVAHDLHPEYLSTKHAKDLLGVELVGVQHHHAHIASCLADNGVAGPVLGVAFDGLGHGEDGTIWGGEFLLADLVGYQRVGHLAPVPLPGGAAAIREPWRMAAAYGVPGDLEVARRNEERWEAVVALARGGAGSPATSSAGRLFDAVAAVLGVRDRVTYEGQAAIELEGRAHESRAAGAYPVEFARGADRWIVQSAPLISEVAAEARRGVPVADIARRFHSTLIEAVRRTCRRLRDESGLNRIVLSGGVFMNEILLSGSVAGLEEDGFSVHRHRLVPPNDGGLCLGQLAVAAAGGGR